MKRHTLGTVALLTALVTAGSAAAQNQQTRQPVELPADVEAIFLAQMLGHVVTLDAIMMALGKGDYEAAAAHAEEGVGQRRESGADASGRTDTTAEPGPGVGIAAYVPDEFMEIAGAFHDAGLRFAERARAMPDAPNHEDHLALMASFAEVTNQCRICHDSFIVP